MNIKLLTSFRRMCYLILTAWMLGVSNIILEETRMVHETGDVMEQQEKIPDTDLDANDTYKLKEV